MSIEIFEARWKCLRELRDQGHEELEEFLGGSDELGAPFRTGLLVKVERCCEWQRYQGLVPSGTGAHYLTYVPEHHIIVVQRDRKQVFHEALLADPRPGEPLMLDPGALPCGLTPAPPAAPVRRTDFDPLQEMERLRQEELDCWLLEGYQPLDEFMRENNIAEKKVLDSGLVRRNDPRLDDHDMPWVPTGKGSNYLLLNAAWDLLLIKPDMGRNLFMLVDPDRARGWMAA